ncbi:MAG: mechanosensitive ion channel [Herminiimonas sp.]|nr:mechanosensitive ion channel [Herminiimonas sp.]
MNANLLSNLLMDFWSDLSTPGVAWQIGTLAGCIALGWGISRGLRAAVRGREVNMRMVRLGVESFSRVLSPVLALILIAIAKPVLARTHHVNLLRLAVPLLASFALIRLAFYILRRIFARNGHAGSVLLMFEKVFAILVWIGVALYITGLWPDLIQFMDDTVLPMGRYKISLLSLVQGTASVLVTLMVALWIGALIEDRLMQVDGMHSSMRTVMARLCRALLVVVAVLVSLSLVGIDLTVLSVFGGALGVGIGLGLQKIIGSYVSGFVILLERSLAIGDMVTVDKYYGRVTRINTRYTVVRSLDGIETVVPNDMLISGPVQNYSLSDRVLRIASQVTIGYDSDLEAVLTLLEQAVLKIERVSKEQPPNAVLLRFGPDGLELEVGFWIADPENGRTNVLSEANRAIWHALKAANVQIPFPQREVRFTEAPPASAGAVLATGN